MVTAPRRLCGVHEKQGAVGMGYLRNSGEVLSESLPLRDVGYADRYRVIVYRLREVLRFNYPRRAPERTAPFRRRRAGGSIHGKMLDG